MTRITDLSLLTGWLPVVLTVLGAVGAVWLLLPRARRYVTTVMPIVVLTAVVLTVALYLFVEEVWRPFPDPIAVSVYALIGVAVAAVLLVVPRILVRRTVWTGVVTVLAAAVVLLAVGVRINLEYASYPTVSAALGIEQVDRIDAAELTGREQVISARPLEPAWHAPGGDTEALLRTDPLELLRSRAYPDSVGAFVVGADDETYRPQVERMYQAAKDAGMDVRLRILPGGYNFALWEFGLRDQLPWPATRLGLTP
ncbi:hypothetical protein [Nocardia fluminea]|uniref:hypothetical protein n=1 Tax=Nocardia fluminea TaxID=134984 RepID=UPI0037A6CF8C